MGRLIFILGGARSGKSDYAQALAEELGAVRAYVATAQAHDGEMAERIATHQAARGAGWQTVEAPLQVASAVREAGLSPDVYLLDCLTLLASNVLMQFEEGTADSVIEEALQSEMGFLLDLQMKSDPAWIVVSNEVGLGIVPAYPSGRLYRDVLGRANQKLAARADVVVFMAAGLPLFLKGSLRGERGSV
jgi:adenosylcobinamide kinase / adenosylcobinamide-phosphate guanylyltransferase